MFLYMLQSIIDKKMSNIKNIQKLKAKYIVFNRLVAKPILEYRTDSIIQELLDRNIIVICGAEVLTTERLYKHWKTGGLYTTVTNKTLTYYTWL